MIKTQDLPSASTLAQNDTLVANVGGKTKKVPVSLLTADLIRDGDKSVAGSIDELQEQMSASSACSAGITALQSQSQEILAGVANIEAYLGLTTDVLGRMG